MCTEQKVTVGEPEREGRLRKASNNEQNHTPCEFARRIGLECVDFWVRLKSVLVEQDSEVRVAGEGHKLIRDVLNMITGLL